MIFACQNSSGFGAIWSQIFFRRKIYEIRSRAQASHQKLLKSYVRTVPNDFNDMNEEFYLCQKFYGYTTRFIFFYAEFVFSVTVPGPGRYLNQNFLRYGERPSCMILWKQGNFCVSKLPWAHKFNFDRCFRLSEIGSKSCSKLDNIS